MDHKISKTCSDTETLLDQYRKKVKDVSDNVEKTRQFKEEINFKVGQQFKTLDRISTNCDSNHSNMGNHVDRIALKFSEQTVDLSHANEGFERELERIGLLFNELDPTLRS